jgi:hypothetical protein
MKKRILYFVAVSCLIIVLFSSCEKKNDELPKDDTPTGQCSNFSFGVSSSSSNDNGVVVRKITAQASGGTNIQFNINGGTFQSSGTFDNLAAGTYIVTAKNNEGCTSKATVSL